jgi:hypothetical protein
MATKLPPSTAMLATLPPRPPSNPYLTNYATPAAHAAGVSAWRASGNTYVGAESPAGVAAETLGGEPMPRTSAEFWAQRMSGMAPQSADKRYQLPAFGRRRRGGEGEMRATPATPAMPAASSLPASPVRADGAGRLYRR